MLRQETRSWRSELQRRLDREIPTTMQVLGGEEAPQIVPQDHAHCDLFFGPYGTSPIMGLHFETTDDTATS